MKSLIRFIFCICIAVAVNGCGIQWPTPFFPTAIQLTDLEPIYQTFCPNSTRSLQNVIPIDVNKDGRQDLVLSLWCSPVTDKSYYEGPTPSRIVVLIQDSLGNFANKTSAVFGTDIVQPGGSSEYYVLGDFNKDGYMDIVFSESREDGRNEDGLHRVTLWSPPMSMMSQGNGIYKLIQIGESPGGEGGSLALVSNSFGQKDVITVSYSQPTQGWSFNTQNAWTPISGYDWIMGSASILFFSNSSTQPGVNLAINSEGSLTDFGVRLYTQIDNVWVKGGGFFYQASTIQKVDWGSSQTSNSAFASINGQDFIDPSFSFNCQIRRTPNSTPEAFTVFQANQIIGGYQGQVVVYGQTPLKELFQFMSFSPLNGGLVRNDLTIRNEITTNVFANRVSCIDLNGDGYDDILLHASRNLQTPIVYLNDGTGAFNLVKSSAFPLSPDYGIKGLSNYILTDIDGDGINDLIYFPIVGTGGSPIRLQMYKGLRPINTLDIVK